MTGWLGVHLSASALAPGSPGPIWSPVPNLSPSHLSWDAGMARRKSEGVKECLVSALIPSRWSSLSSQLTSFPQGGRRHLRLFPFRNPSDAVNPWASSTQPLLTAPPQGSCPAA